MHADIGPRMFASESVLLQAMLDQLVPDARPGSYALLLRIAAPLDIAIGRRYRLVWPAGWAMYVGSALGPGGLAARLRHHRRPAQRPHWHIDALRPYAPLDAIWFSYDAQRRECLWAGLLGGLFGGQRPVFRFGASDCRCPSHLYHFTAPPDLNAFAAALHEHDPGHAPLQAC